MSLAIEYRPKTLDEIRGNESTIKALTSCLSKSRESIQHSFLFTGLSGGGKTTLARIVANMLGCVGSDFHEIDSADFRGIDSVREIRRNMMYTPAEGSCSVWLLDECHQNTKDAQTALLKALEDAPDHVYFMLATTDPEKLLSTVKGRCATFEVQPLDLDEMVDFLTDIARQERKRVHVDVIKQIARDSMGSCRNALQVLDKIIDLPAADMLIAAERTAAQENQVIELCRSLFAGEKWPKISTILRGLEKEDVEKTRLAVINYCANVLLSEKTKDAPQAYVVLDCFKDPFYNSGRAGLVRASYEAVESCK